MFVSILLKRTNHSPFNFRICVQIHDPANNNRSKVIHLHDFRGANVAVYRNDYDAAQQVGNSRRGIDYQQRHVCHF